MKYSMGRVGVQVLTLMLSALMLAGCKKSDDQSLAIEAGKTLAESGKAGVPACQSCHGVNGEGMAATGYPRLAGMNAQYLEKQLNDLARDLPAVGVVIPQAAKDYSMTPRIYSDLTVFTPGLRHDDVMSPIAKSLSVADRHNLAVYFGSLAFKAQPVPADFEVLERGQDLALRGKPEYGLPACVSCHAPDGEGFGADFPALAGQPAAYIIKEIDDWQAGSRDNDNLGLMHAVADQLTDGDKIDVAAYFANRSLTVNGK